jgi:hypothetical protein
MVPLKSSMNFGMGAMKKRYDIATLLPSHSSEIPKSFAFAFAHLSSKINKKLCE